jgi:hypothetical protein
MLGHSVIVAVAYCVYGGLTVRLERRGKCELDIGERLGAVACEAD